MDLIGVTGLAIVTAIGGGTIRDVLLDRPVFWIREPTYLSVCLASAAIMVVWMRFWRPPESSLGVADALGLGLFAIGGAQIARQLGSAPVIVILMGTITGVAGGIIRDMLAAEIPTIFRRGQLYASAAITGTTANVLLAWTGIPEAVAAFTSMAIVVAIRFAAVFFGIDLPTPRIASEKSRDES
jgi:uncharacterized membrane protein YeiH